MDSDASSNLICKHCDLIFSDSSNLRRHNRTCHLNQKPHKCDICGRIFGRSDHLRRHLLRHTQPKIQYTCNFKGCKRYFSDPIRLEHHCLQHLKKQSEAVIIIKGYTVQKLNGPAIQLLLCPIHGCGKRYSSYGGMAKHLNAHAQGTQLPQKHSLKQSHSVKEYTCSQCSKTFSRQRSLIAHVAKAHDSDSTRSSFACTYPGCNNIYTTKSNLNMHVKIAHAPHKPFVCDACNATFKWKRSLTRHVCKGIK